MKLPIPMPTATKFSIREQSLAQVKEKIFHWGAAGGGKSRTALVFADALKGKGKVGVIDTEKRINLYSKHHKFKIVDFDAFKDGYHPVLLPAIGKQLVDEGCSVVIVDSLTDFWDGKMGAMELQAILQASGGRYKVSQLAWAEINKLWAQAIRELLDLDVHVIVTARDTRDDKGNLKPACQKHTRNWFNTVLWFDEGTGHVVKSDVTEAMRQNAKYPDGDFILNIQKLRTKESKDDKN